ncbi:tetraacyldisaccharide 4'-kinase [Psychroflexus aestuariivivens]|uniref:tetraacyldisaccharide 4'-kinase n=1 Tax=Psychroflexus aestuariivivens TaxID=1795040 RepID=UPI000FD8C1FB|nr:tetraacyldisaccharide 4'-kinase [Psychroflexus aestuariivivens]
MKFLRYLLFPFGILYAIITNIRNWLFDLNILKSKSFEVPVICVGNLNVGGTGKSPMIEYLLRNLNNEFRIATLSRGYKRETSGYQVVSENSSAKDVGDEPLQFKLNFNNILVAVDEDRQHGISNLLKSKYSPNLILLDDAFQHRKVQADFNILLTAYGDLYCDDFILPVGNLRETKAGAKRAQCIVVTKCPKNLSKENQQEIIKKLNPNSNQNILFSYIDYADSVMNNKDNTIKTVLLNDFDDFTLVTGIANPQPLLSFLKERNKNFEHLKFPDHHHFSESDLKSINSRSLILTTQKDYVRLRNFVDSSKLYYLPIETKIIGDNLKLTNQVKAFLENQR